MYFELYVLFCVFVFFCVCCFSWFVCEVVFMFCIYVCTLRLFVLLVVFLLLTSIAIGCGMLVE